MSELLPRVIVTGLAASVSPVAVMILISVMFKKNARRNSLLFLLGYTLVLIGLGVAGIYLFHAGSSGRPKSNIEGYIDVALGVLCFAALLLNFRKGTKKREPDAEADLKASRAFLLGIIAMLVNLSTLIFFISGTHEISSARLGASDDLLALSLLIAFTLITLIIPIAVFFAFPARAESALGSLKAWLAKHNKVIGAAVLVAFGTYLVVKGIRAII